MARLLIIDDDEQVRLTLTEVVESLGHQATTAPDGRSGLELFERQGFDGVITDLAMPEVDGLTVLRRIKRLRPDMGVLVVTGNSTVDLLAAAVNMGVDSYVTKPFKIAELDRQLSSMLARSRSGPAAAGGSRLRRLAGSRVLGWAILGAALVALLGRLLAW